MLKQHHTHQAGIDSPVFNTPSEKCFVVEAAVAGGVLGIYLGLFNSYEMEKIRSSMSKLEDSHNLLIQVTRTQVHQIQVVEIGLAHLQEFFPC